MPCCSEFFVLGSIFGVSTVLFYFYGTNRILLHSLFAESIEEIGEKSFDIESLVAFVVDEPELFLLSAQRPAHRARFAFFVPKFQTLLAKRMGTRQNNLCLVLHTYKTFRLIRQLSSRSGFIRSSEIDGGFVDFVG